jgi:hypothetical protein
MKPLKAAFFIAVAVILGLWPLSAQASCSGSACSSFKVENKTYSTSDKKFHATLVNTDPSKKIRLKGCMGSTKSPAPWCWDVSIDHGKSVPVENGVGSLDKPEEAAKHSKDFVVEITSAEFLEEVVAPKPPAKPADIKVSVVNGDSVGLIVRVVDAGAGHEVVSPRMLGINNTLEVTLDNKGGKGHLKWEVYTLRQGQSSSMLRFTVWNDYDTYEKGVGVVLVGTEKYFVALKQSKNVKPPNAEYWEGVTNPNAANPGAPPARCGEGDGNYATGEKVIIKTSHVCG